MPSEGLNRRAPTPLRRPAVQPAPPARGVGAARTGPSPADLQLRLGNRGTQAFLEKLAPARAEAAGLRDFVAPPVAQAPAGTAGLTEDRALAKPAAKRTPDPGAAPNARQEAAQDTSPAVAQKAETEKALAKGLGIEGTQAALGNAQPEPAEPAAAESGATDAAAPAGGRADGAGPPRMAPAEATGPPPGRKERAAAGPPPTAPAGSSAALLASLAGVPASRFGAAVARAIAEAPRLQMEEKQGVQASIPPIRAPTGLPRRGAPPNPAGAKLPVVSPPALPAGGTLAGTGSAAAGLTGGELASEAVGPLDEPAEEEGSWWDWLTGTISRLLGAVGTTDPGLSTSAGPTPRIDLTGDADPARAETHGNLSARTVGQQRRAADAAAQADFGENDVYPTVPDSTVGPSTTPAPPEAKGAAAAAPPRLPADLLAAFDRGMAARLDREVGTQIATHRQGEAEYRAKSDEARADGQRQLDEAAAQAVGEQLSAQQGARTEVAAARSKLKAENAGIEQRFSTEASAKQAQAQNDIRSTAKAGEEKADRDLRDAEAKAEAERRAAEDKAAAEKRRIEEQPRSWWERVKGAVNSVFSALKKAVNGIFNAARKAVKFIIDGAKQLTLLTMEVTRRAIIAVVEAVGESFKALVSVALAAFPEAAERARRWIDGKVTAAVAAVDAAAKWLKETYASIFDSLAKSLDMLLGFFQAILNVGLELLRLLATGDFETLYKIISTLAGAAYDGVGMAEGEVYREIVGFDLTKDLGPQLLGSEADGDSDGDLEQKAEGGNAANISFLLQDKIRDDQVEVSPIPEVELDDNLLNQLGGDGEEQSIGADNDPERSSDAAIRELLEPLADPESKVAAKAPGAPDNDSLDKEAAELDPEMSAIVARASSARSRGERAGVIKDLMWAGLKQYWRQTLLPNLWWIIPTALLVLVAFIAAEYFTGGAITAALPEILEVIAGFFIAADLARMSGHLSIYLEKGMAGDRGRAAKAFARALAVGVVAVLMLLLFEVVGKALKVASKLFARAARATLQAGKAVGTAVVAGARIGARALVKGVLYIGNLVVNAAKIGAKLVARAGRFVLEKGKLIFPGLSQSLAKGVATLKQLVERLKDFFKRFRGFSLEFRGDKILLFAEFNPKKILIAIIRDYRGTFFKAFPKLKGKVVVHHSIERQILTRYPGLFSEGELHLLENLRGIPKTINPDLHLSKIRKLWNEFYRTHPTATRQQVFAMRSKIDKLLGSSFTPPH
ncbi:hypothetical protein ABIF69_004502 [Bradyrhizobium japonicum]